MNGKKKAKPIMIQGTMSNVGKSLIAAGLCRIFKQDGYRVAPFKSQNMALNSFITKENLEMGRAQVVQAQACGIEPSALMNPILLKPNSDMGSQVIVGGEVIGNMKAAEYFERKKEYIPIIKAAYEKLAEEYDIIVIEGAGSPAEINLKQGDIVNMGMAEMADAPVLLAGDIDRGGVFAQLIGTVQLLEKGEQDRVKGLIINKFRGDAGILEPGLDMLSKRCGKEVLGVVPFMQDIDIEEEDSLAGELSGKEITAAIDIAVIRLPRISNFTDFQAFSMEEAVSVRYVTKPEELGNLDVCMIPGTKNTIDDMKWMRESGLEGGVLRLAQKGKIIFGICGGYQMLGEIIRDESGGEKNKTIRGMGLLPVETDFESTKIRRRAMGKTVTFTGGLKGLSGKKIGGYEIHMGRTRIMDKEAGCFATISYGEENHRDDGCHRENVIGTYLHGVFDQEEFRTAFIQILCREKGISYGEQQMLTYEEYKERQYDKLADVLRESLDMERIYQILNEGGNSRFCQDKEERKEDRKEDSRIEKVLPEDIERRSFEIITEELGKVELNPIEEPVIKRVIHTTADFDYLNNLCFSEDAVEKMRQALQRGAVIVADTQMARSGINKKKLAEYGGEVFCFMSDEDVAEQARRKGTTRAVASMEKAVGINKEIIFAIGNAPTALIRLHELIREGKLQPKGIIGVPVGFVNVVEAKELILHTHCPYIVAAGRKGGSNVAAAICNALLYGIR